MVVEEAAEISERILDGDEVADDVVFRFRFLLRFAHNRPDARENLHVGGGPALRDSTLLHALEEPLVFLERGGIGEDGVGMFARKADTGIGRTGLENHRLALRRTLNVQRSFHLEETALVTERVEFLPVEELPGLAVAHEGIVVPAVPQPLITSRYSSAIS